MLRGSGEYDAIVVGSGPNGLVAALVLAKAGWRVLVIESQDTPGGGCRSDELTLPGFVHDICSAIHPTAVVSPAFKELAPKVEFLSPKFPVAHPLSSGQAAILEQSLSSTALALGSDGKAWSCLMEPFLRHEFFEGILKPVWWPPWRLSQLRFGPLGLRSCASLVKRFKGPAAKALFAGCAAHSVVPLDRSGTASFGIVLALAAHLVNWPCIKGGSHKLIEALITELQSLGGEIVLNHKVNSLRALPPAKAVLFDINPAQIVNICADDLPSHYLDKLRRFRHGPGVFKIDWALSAPIPWKNPQCSHAGTVHVGGTFEEIAKAEAEAASGKIPEKPFVLVAQQSTFDITRAPSGKHTGWAYCHVPNGCTADMTMAIESQIERFAPGFRDTILARHTLSAANYETHNPAMPGGDIGGGNNELVPFLFRPFPCWNPYTTPNPRLFTCSSSTPPGGGVHGMCGYLAAQTVLRKLDKKSQLFSR